MMTQDEIKRALAPPTTTVPVICAILGISLNLGYRGVRNGDIPSITVGRLKRIPTAPYRQKLGLEPIVNAGVRDAA